MKVVEYVRMSTDQQRYSIDNQRAAIADYMAARDMELVGSYADSGRSGLTYEQRPALRRLMQDAVAPDRNFEAVVIFDISRWGRFQDADESAYYEYLLRRSSLQVIYCNEPFENDGSPLATIVKSIKRAMAAEYSRELSAKVSIGQQRMASRGFRQGSHAGYGLRRVSITEAGLRRGVLERGERKSAPTDRIVLELGPVEEVETVRRIFHLYVRGRLGPTHICALLTREGVSPGSFKKWHKGAVDKILKNEKYVGDSVYGKQHRRLGGARTAVPEDDWIRVSGAFPAIVDRSLFQAAQGLRRSKTMPSDDEVLARLRRLHNRHGRFTIKLIETDPELPSGSYLRSRFGSLAEVCRQAIGSEAPKIAGL